MPRMIIGPCVFTLYKAITSLGFLHVYTKNIIICLYAVYKVQTVDDLRK